MHELFIYYRIERSSANLALDAAQAMQDRLRIRHPMLTARLLRRPDEPGDKPNDQQTWMEIYSFPESRGISPELQAEVEAEAATALTPFIVGVRHIEIFVPCAS